MTIAICLLAGIIFTAVIFVVRRSLRKYEKDDNWLRDFHDYS